MKYEVARLGRVVVIRLEDGDVVHQCIEEVARREGVVRGCVMLVGGAAGGSTLVVGPEDGAASPVVPMQQGLDDAHEVAGVGTLFPGEDGEPVLHLHVACGRDAEAVVGCVRLGVTTWTILEAVIVEIEGSRAVRRRDPETGFQLLDVEG
ncbi:MAG: DNA-binding protein [Actinobacteria bacterium]|nr:DNA-binding protein [Actinomycetota bacterium]